MGNFKRVIVILVLSLGFIQAQAGELVLNLASKHYKLSNDKTRSNENNYGIGWQTSNFEAGFFKNTYFKNSGYIGKIDRVNNISFNFGIIDHPDTSIYASIKIYLNKIQLGISPLAIFLQVAIPY